MKLNQPVLLIVYTMANEYTCVSVGLEHIIISLYFVYKRDEIYVFNNITIYILRITPRKYFRNIIAVVSNHRIFIGTINNMIGINISTIEVKYTNKT